MKKWYRGVAALLALGCSAGALAGVQDAEPSPSSIGSISSTGQRGGITGYIVGPVTYNEAPPTDTQTRQLASALNTFRTNFMTELRRTLSVSAYVYFTDIQRYGSEPRDADAIYTIYSSDDPDPDYEPVCEVNERVTLGGMAAYVPRNVSAVRNTQTANVSVRMLTRADRSLLQPLCDGLGRPLSWLQRGNDSRARNGQRTVYDYLSRDSGVLVLMLMPGRAQGQEISTDFARYFWAAALIGRYHRIPSGEEVTADPAVYEQMASIDDGQSVNVAFSLPNRFRPGSSGVDVYPPDARREFGTRIDSLDADWVRYLASAAVTIRGRQIPLMNGNRPAAVLPVFSLNEIGTPAFWLASSDAARTYEMVACIGGRFLSDRYQVDASQADMGRCAMAETTLRGQ